MAGMARFANSTPIGSGYKAPVDIGVVFEAFRSIDAKKHPENALLMVPAAQRLVKDMDGLLVIWLFTGDGWGNAGLINCANQLGEKAKPLVAGFKAMRPDLDAKVKANGRDKQALEDILKKMDNCIADYETKYGKVEAAKPVQ
jgi:hypothetical protein